MALFRSLLRIFSGQFSLDEWGPSSLKFPTGKSHLKLEKPVESSGKVQALKAVELTNNYIATNHGDLGMFATLFFGILDPVTGSLLYINGGHEPLLVIDSSGGVKAHLRPTGPAVGVQAGLEYKTNEIILAPGDIMIGYTDGVPEAKSSSGEFFSKERVMSLLDTPVPSATRLIREIVVSVTEHMGEGDQYDDLTLVAVRRKIATDSEDKGSISLLK
jgi:two-component system response regulator